MEGFVHSMETFGLVDGPGVRFVVFLQGCRMRCRYCHNPETWKLEGGTPWTADKLFSHVYRYKSYWNKKGQPNGGITVSGGEPLLQIDFVTEFFKKAKDVQTIISYRWQNGCQTTEKICGCAMYLCRIRPMTKKDW